MKRISKILAFLLVFAIILPGMAQAAPAVGTAKVERVSGLNRSLTSIAASKKVYTTADTVVLAGYNGSADALSATALAVSKDAPMLITAGGKTISPEVKAEITRLNAKKVYIIGGTTVVPAAIENDLKAMKVTVERLQGRNRFQTAARLAQVSSQKSKVFLTIGRNLLSTGLDDSLADALAIGPVSAKNVMPILLAQTNKLPAETRAALTSLGVKEVTIIGGELAISPKVAAEIQAMGITITRDAGSNRYETAVIIAKKYFKDASNIIVANGRKDADALVGGYLGVKWNAPILLTAHNKLAPETKTYLEDMKLDTYVLGGEVVVENRVVTEIESAITGVGTRQEAKDAFNKEAVKLKEIKDENNVKVADITFNAQTATASVTLFRADYLEVAGTGIFAELAELGVRQVSFDGGNTWMTVQPDNAEEILAAADIVVEESSFVIRFRAKVQPEGKHHFTQGFKVKFTVK